MKDEAENPPLPLLHPYAHPMPFEITTTRDFSASHQLRFPDGSLEPLHGHNWRASVTVASDGLDALGCVMDFHELQRWVNAVIDPMHNAHLNDLPAFEKLNPSTENVALHIGTTVNLPAGVRVARVSVWETWDCCATWLAGH